MAKINRYNNINKWINKEIKRIIAVIYEFWQSYIIYMKHDFIYYN